MKKAADITPPEWMTAPATRAVLDALTSRGQPARFVGGCVRDAVAQRAVKDVDIATPETPEDVTEILTAAGIKVAPTGIDHGTVTAVTRGSHFEVTTLRQDVETYGRRAKVAFTDAWEDDAARRDFTMNAMYADADGAIYDPTGGLPDLKAGRVRFVGDAETRIREDVLRLLRYFRFYADFGHSPPDPEAIAACRKMAPEVPTLSVERVWSELQRLLASPRAPDVVALMHDEGVLAHILPEVAEISRLAPLVGLEAALALKPDPVRRLAALLDLDEARTRAFAGRLKLTNAQSKRLAAIAKARGDVDPTLEPVGRRAALYRLGTDLYIDLILLDWANAIAANAADSAAEEWRALWNEAVDWHNPVFPLSGSDVMTLGVSKGPRIGKLLRAVEEWWIEQDFAPGREDCLARLKALAEESGA